MHGASDVTVVMLTQTVVCDVLFWSLRIVSFLTVSVSVCYLDNSSEQTDVEPGVAESKSAVLNFLYSRQVETFTDS
jgi:hypothetical protein